MKPPLRLDIRPQPDDTTCGPTCLHAIYRYYEEEISLNRIIADTKSLDEGGTLAVFLACHALRRGYRARIYTYNLQVFDPTWFVPGRCDLRERLRAQLRHKHAPKLRTATQGYLEFLELGGEMRYEELSAKLIRRYLKRGVPILTGLSATYLYQSAREYGPLDEHDDLRGEPAGHFVVLCGYQKKTRLVSLADPLHPNPMAPSQNYEVAIDRVLNAILLGVLTHDANLLVIERPRGRSHREHSHSR